MIAVLDYGIGNLRSAEKALQHVGGDARLVTTAEQARGARGVVLPGVGAFGRAMDALRASGLDRVALAAIDSGTPFLGICVGLQLLFAGSQESPGVAGLGVFDSTVVRLGGDVKLPQMQWNRLEVVGGRRAESLVDQTPSPWMYFVHSYAAPAHDPAVVATCDYGGPVAALVEVDNVWATQFHPEKSAAAGLTLLRRFVDRVSGVDAVDRVSGVDAVDRVSGVDA